MANIITKDRYKAYLAIINTWLKSSSENIDDCQNVIAQNKLRRGKLNDSFGGMKNNPKDIRIGLSLPVGLYYVLSHFERMHNRNFMKSKEDLRWFSKKFPQFVVPEKI